MTGAVGPQRGLWPWAIAATISQGCHVGDTASLGSDTCSVDLQTDVDNCGACNHPCGSFAPCQFGVCTPQALASGFPSAYALAIDDSTVFFSSFDFEGGSIMRVEKRSGTVTTVARQVGRVYALVPRSESLWFTAETAASTVRRVPKTGGLPVDEADHAQGAQGAAGDNAFFYWAMPAAGDDQGLWRVRFDGSAAAEHVVSSLAVNNVAVMGTDVFLGLLGGAVYRASTSTGAVSLLANGQSRVWGLTADDTSVYFATNDTVARVPREGGAVEVLADGQSTAQWLVRDGDILYFTAFDDGTVMKLSLTDRRAFALAKGPAGPKMCVIDEAYIYWTDWSGKLLRVPK